MKQLHQNDQRSFQMFGKWYHWGLKDGALSLAQGPTPEDQAKAEAARARIETVLGALEKHGAEQVDDSAFGTLTEAEFSGEVPVIHQTPDLHRIDYVDVSSDNRMAQWCCACGKTGNTSSSHEGEDLKAKALKNHGAHARREAKKAEQALAEGAGK